MPDLSMAFAELAHDLNSIQQRLTRYAQLTNSDRTLQCIDSMYESVKDMKAACITAASEERKVVGIGGAN